MARAAGVRRENDEKTKKKKENEENGARRRRAPEKNWVFTIRKTISEANFFEEKCRSKQVVNPPPL